MKDAQTIRQGLLKIDLDKMFRSINLWLFEGRVEKHTMVWESDEEFHYKSAMAYHSRTDSTIHFKLSVFVGDPKQFLRIFVHEMIHALKPGDYRLKSTRNCTPEYKALFGKFMKAPISHGEKFGQECRRINAKLGWKLMPDNECSYGTKGRRWAEDNVKVKCNEYIYKDGFGIDTADRCTFEGSRREMRSHKAWHNRQWDQWYLDDGLMRLFKDKIKTGRRGVDGKSGAVNSNHQRHESLTPPQAETC